MRITGKCDILRISALPVSLFAQFTDSVLESYQGPSWRADLPLFICATTYWLSPGTSPLLLLATGTFQTCADMDLFPTDLCLREEQDVVTVSLLLLMLTFVYAIFGSPYFRITSHFLYCVDTLDVCFLCLADG